MVSWTCSLLLEMLPYELLLSLNPGFFSVIREKILESNFSCLLQCMKRSYWVLETWLEVTELSCFPRVECLGAGVESPCSFSEEEESCSYLATVRICLVTAPSLIWIFEELVPDWTLIVA